MKKVTVILTAALLALALLVGCTAPAVEEAAAAPEPAAQATPEPSEPPVNLLDDFTQENDIITYEKLDPDKTQITVSSLGNNADILHLSEAFEAANPDVQVIRFDLTGGTSDYSPAVDMVKHGVAPDIMFLNSNTFYDDEILKENFEDLSAISSIKNFQTDALNNVAIDGHIYLLPAPSEINCMMYNKTLFEQYGWEVPSTFDEFVALCAQITKDTNGQVQPWNPNAKYDTVFSTALQAFTYTELFGGVDNRAWYNEFCAGNATFAGHMEPMYDVIQTLIDNNILKEEHFNYSATTRGREFQTGQIAMYNAPITRMTSEEFTFAYMPYPATVGEARYVNAFISSLLGVPKQEHTEAETDAINRFLEFYASVEGQQALIADSLMVSNVIDVPLNDAETMADIQDVITQGHMFNRIEFPGDGKVTWTFRENALSMLTGEKTSAECIADIDAHPYETVEESGAGTEPPIATVAEAFTVLEFSEYIADMYRETAGAEIGLINHGIPYRGNLVRLFPGEIYNSYMFPIRPRSFDNDSTLIKVSMTGQQLLDALNHPVGNNRISNSIYAFSGLKCTVAPWNELGEKYLSVELTDGSAIEADKLYTVAFWAGSVSEEYITEVLETYEGIWDDVMAAYMAAGGTIAPAKDGRITLVWE